MDGEANLTFLVDEWNLWKVSQNLENDDVLKMLSEFCVKIVDQAGGKNTSVSKIQFILKALE